MARVTWISPWCAVGIHPARHVHRITPEVVQEALASDDAGHDRPRADPDPELETKMADSSSDLMASRMSRAMSAMAWA